MTIQAIIKTGVYSISDITLKSVSDTEAEDLFGSRLSTSLGFIGIPSSSTAVGAKMLHNQNYVFLIFFLCTNVSATGAAS